MEDQSLVDGLVNAPLGATLLRILQGLRQGLCSDGAGVPSLGPLPSVQAAAESVTEMTTDELVDAMLTASSNASPWSGAPEEITENLSTAPTRRRIAEAVVATHRRFLTAALDWANQVAWFGSDLPVPLIGDLTAVYECGEFPWGGLRTHTALSSRHDGALWASHDGGYATGLTVWRFPVRADARIAEINTPQAWLELVRRHPRQVNPFGFLEDRGRRMLACLHNAWDIRLRSIEADGTATVALIDGSEKTGVRGLLMPDWTSVAAEFDGVHISWAGLLLAEGNVVDVGDGWLAVARFWGSERTLFLADVFERPEPIGAVNPR